MRYLANSSTRQIHDKQHIRPQCNKEVMLEDASNVREIGLTEMKTIMREAGYDFCDHCFDEVDEEGEA